MASVGISKVRFQVTYHSPKDEEVFLKIVAQKTIWYLRAYLNSVPFSHAIQLDLAK